MSELGNQVYYIGLPECRYEYQPLLDTSLIRLLMLAPNRSENNDSLTGVIFDCPLPAAGKYRALSYVWGTDKPSRRIQTPSGFMDITTNLFAALCRLRDTFVSPIVWVDAICINQKDNQEKAHQIQKMREIHKDAVEVPAFLGPEEEDSDVAIDLLANLAGKDLDVESCRPKSLDDLERCGFPPVEDRAWSSLERFVRRPWFRRMWIVQECVVAKQVTVFWGNEWSLSLEELAVLPFQLYRLQLPILQVRREGDEYDHDDRGSGGNNCLFELIMLRTQYWTGGNIDLFSMLVLCQNVESTLARDKYFAILGICSSSAEPTLQPNYEEPLVKVAIRYTRFLMESGAGYSILSLAQSRSPGQNLPSWIPSWSSTTVYKILSQPLGPQEYDYYSTATALPPLFHIAPDEGLLMAHGALYDFVKVVGFDHWPKPRFDQKAFTPVLMIWLNAVHFSQFGSLRFLEDRMREHLWETVTLGKFSRSLEPLNSLFPWINTTETAGKRARKAAREVFQNIPDFSLSAGSCFTAAQPAFFEMGDQLLGWNFAVLLNGSIGMVPITAQKGDVIAIVAGARVPYVLRPIYLSRPFRYKLIGECYIHGILNGEVGNLPGLCWHDLVLV